jgi:hypothetical protein
MTFTAPSVEGSHAGIAARRLTTGARRPGNASVKVCPGGGASCQHGGIAAERRTCGYHRWRGSADEWGVIAAAFPPRLRRSSTRARHRLMPRPMTTRLLLMLLACASFVVNAAAAQPVELPPPAGTVTPSLTVPSPEPVQPVVPYLGPLEEPPFAPPALDAEMSATLEPAAPTMSAAPSAAYGYGGSAYDPSYSWQLMPQGLIYRSYLAGAKESRFRSVWNNESSQGNIWDITLGGNVGILRYGTRGNVRPEGWQLGIEGAGLVRLDIDEDRDVDAADFRFGIPMTWGDSIYQVKFAYYHLSSHVGDEFLLKTPGFHRLNYSRDVLVWGHSLYPLPDWRVYGEIGYAFFCDVGEPWETQFGIDWSPDTRTGPWGAPFAAFNGHLREEVDFGGNLVVQTGWAWRRTPATGLFRVGVEYYNGKDDQFSFFDNSVQKFGGAIWYDY